MSNFRELCDELRCWATDRLVEFRERALREARRHEGQALAALRSSTSVTRWRRTMPRVTA